MNLKTKVVVIGAGFGGLEAVKKLANNPYLSITLIDRSNHHLFQPLLYQVATAVLSPADIAIPTRAITRHKPNVSVLMAEVTRIDKDTRTVYFDDDALQYDYLILALGARTGYFGRDDWQQFTVGLKSIPDALAIRRKLLLSFEQAELNPLEAPSLLRYIIGGGGPTGVELAGSIAELAREIIRKDFRHIDPATAQITLIEAGDRVLGTFSPKLSEYAKKELELRGVEVRVSTRVQNIDADGVHLGEGIVLKSNFIIWAAGVEANPMSQQLGVPLDRAKRVMVNQFCSLEANPEIFVIGDMANFTGENGKPLPGVSPVAMQQGRYVADLIRDQLRGKTLKPFKYFDKGSMATIGRQDGVAEMKSLRLTGLIGWLAWLFVHLLYLVGFKNRVSTLMTWFWSYLTLGAGARVIQEPVHSQQPAQPPVPIPAQTAPPVPA